MGGQRCARPGCRAWAMRGRSFCRAHQHLEQEPVDEVMDASEEERNLPVIPLELIAEKVEALLAECREIDSEAMTLWEEIGSLRLVLARVLAEEPDVNRQASSVARIINTEIRAAQTQRLLSGAKAGAITEAVTQILIELGLGSDEDQ